MIVKLDAPSKAAVLFAGWDETIIWSCLQNVMGEIYADNAQSPKSAVAVLGDFRFFAGVPNRELVYWQPHNGRREFTIMVPRSDSWAALINAHYIGQSKKITRYAIKKEPDIFQREKLIQAVRSLPPQFTMKMIDEDIYHQCRADEWSRDLVSQYEDYRMYRELGLGVVIIKDGQPVSGASSYTSYKEGIEIEIDTKKEYRRMGLAYACGARLILECMDRGLYPSWDAHSLESVALAEKLGYHLDHEYTAFEVYG